MHPYSCKEEIALYIKLSTLYRTCCWFILCKETSLYHQNVESTLMGQMKVNVDHHCHLRVILSVVNLGSFHFRILVPEKYAAQAVALVE